MKGNSSPSAERWRYRNHAQRQRRLPQTESARTTSNHHITMPSNMEQHQITATLQHGTKMYRMVRTSSRQPMTIDQHDKKYTWLRKRNFHMPHSTRTHGRPEECKYAVPADANRITRTHRKHGVRVSGSAWHHGRTRVMVETVGHAKGHCVLRGNVRRLLLTAQSRRVDVDPIHVLLVLS